MTMEQKNPFLSIFKRNIIFHYSIPSFLLFKLVVTPSQFFCQWRFLSALLHLYTSVYIMYEYFC